MKNLERQTGLRLLGLFIIFTVLALIAMVNHTLDRSAQDLFFVGNGHWLISKVTHPRLHFIFYILPKILLIALAIFLIGKCFWNFKAGKTKRAASYSLAVIFLAIFPFAISLLKSISQVPCPYDLAEYGGKLQNLSAGKCFPAGHASGGFALIGLIFLARTKKEMWFYICGAVFFGLLMGFYQQVRGSHFLSHTLVTQALCFGAITLLQWLFIKSNSEQDPSDLSNNQ